MNICPVCGSDQLRDVVQPELFKYEGYTAFIENYHSIECSNCGEAFPTEESIARSQPILRDLQRKAERLLTSDQIRNIRKSLGYTQDEFGIRLGGGKKAFARYENGTVMQSRAMDNLLRGLAACPQLLEVMQGETVEGWTPVKERLVYPVGATARANTYSFRSVIMTTNHVGEAA